MFLQVVVWIVVAVAALVVGREVGKWAFGAKKNLSVMRKAAQTLAISMREAGLKTIPVMLEDFAVGELDDLLEGVKTLSITLKSGNGVIMQELQGTFDRMLVVKLQSPEGRALIESRLAEAKQAALEVAKVVGPVVAKAAITAALV